MKTRVLIAALCAGTGTIFLVGCGSSMMSGSGTTAATGSAPSVTASAVQVNGVAPNRKQEVQFSEAMDPTTINAKTFTVINASGSTVSGAVSYDPTYQIASFSPDPALQTNTTYKATIGTGVAAAGGTHMAAPYSYGFTTRASTDTSPLSINSVSPADNATCVSTSMPIVITFSEAPDASTVNAGNIMVAGPGGAAVAVTMSINVSTTQVVLKPTAPLPSGTITVTVQNVADLAGVKMTTPYTWSYSTACGGGGGTGGGATMQYEATLLLAAGQSTMNGRVSVDTSGNTTIHLTNATASTTYSVQFCPAFDSNTGSTAPACLNVTTLSTDTSGNASSTVKFPKPGDWAGDFNVNDKSGKTIYSTYLVPTMSNETYMATLLPDTMTNGGAVTTNSPQQPLTSGTVTYSNGTLQFTVQGASPNTAYETNSSETVYMDSSGTYGLSHFTTDGSGNGSSSFTWGNLSPGGDLFQVQPEADFQSVSGPAGYIGGFSVPQ